MRRRRAGTAQGSCRVRRTIISDNPGRMAVAALAAVLGLAVTGCLGSKSDKAGGAQHQKPVVLTMANSNNFPLELEPFAAAAARLSNHTIRIEFKNDWRKGAPSYETGMIGDVKAGKADLGSAGSRAFDSVGVPAFDPLHAPLLIDSYALEQRVLQSPLVGEMLHGLEPLGVVGLGILPGEMHKPLGVSRLVRAADYRGKTIAISRSRIAQQTLGALGASTKEIPFSGGIGASDGIEQEVGAIEANYDKIGKYLTANVNLWPRPLVVFINRHAFAALSEAQRDALREAARVALPATMAIQRGGEKEGAATRCRRGVRFVTASDADLGSIRVAVQPVYDRLERDRQTKAAIEQIRAMRSRDPSTTDAPRCSRTRSTTRTAGKVTPIDGVYRMTTTRKEAAKAFGDAPRDTVSENYGRWRFVLDRGRLYYTQSSEGASRWTKALYTVNGDTVAWRVTDYGGEAPNGAAEKTGEMFTYRWSRYRDQLTLTPVAGKVSPPWAKPWRRIGDAR